MLEAQGPLRAPPGALLGHLSEPNKLRPHSNIARVAIFLFSILKVKMNSRIAVTKHIRLS